MNQPQSFVVRVHSTDSADLVPGQGEDCVELFKRTAFSLREEKPDKDNGDDAFREEEIICAVTEGRYISMLLLKGQS